MKIGLNFVSPLAFVLQRFTIASIALLPVLVLLRKRIPKDSGTLGKLLFLSVINVAQLLVTSVGLLGESSGVGAVLTYTQPLFVFCLAIPFLKEKITSIKLVGAVIGFVGIVVLFLGKKSSLTLNSTLVMIFGGFLWAVTTVYYKEYLNHVNPFFTNFFQMTIGALCLAALSLTTTSFVFPTEATYVWAVLYASVGSLVLGWTIWMILLKRGEATVLSGSIFIVPVVALLFGWLLLGESIKIESILGSALVLGGVCIVNLKSSARANSARQPHPYKQNITFISYQRVLEQTAQDD